jgi:hypothetical protein
MQRVRKTKKDSDECKVQKTRQRLIFTNSNVATNFPSSITHTFATAYIYTLM